jgi:DNA-binding response OmpR family regulator
LEKKQIEVFMTDLGLAGMSGNEFCSEVRSRWLRIGIIFATGASQGPVLSNPSRTALLSKPHGLEELRKALEAVAE